MWDDKDLEEDHQRKEKRDQVELTNKQRSSWDGEETKVESEKKLIESKGDQQE